MRLYAGGLSARDADYMRREVEMLTRKKGEMEEEVRRAAAESFLRFRGRGTAGGTAILLYVSLFEHRVGAAKRSGSKYDLMCKRAL